MLKTVKGKVFVGTVAVGLLSGAGVALSTSSAGVNLKKWVDKKAGQVFCVQESIAAKVQKPEVSSIQQRRNLIRIESKSNRAGLPFSRQSCSIPEAPPSR